MLCGRCSVGGRNGLTHNQETFAARHSVARLVQRLPLIDLRMKRGRIQNASLHSKPGAEMNDVALTPVSPARGEPSVFDAHYAPRGEYQRSDTTQTLRAALAEYYLVNPGLSDPATITDPKSARYFHNHDCTHVVFGTHTGPLDEGVNDLFTFFGVDVRYFDYITGFFATKESKQIVKSYAGPSILALTFRTLRLLPKTRRTCRAMTKKWPWDPPEDVFDQPLAEIRAVYGIELWRPEDAFDLDKARSSAATKTGT